MSSASISSSRAISSAAFASSRSNSASIDPATIYRTGEDNGDAHHKRQIMGREVVVAITDGQLDFGTWEQIFYGEFDGRRRKRILIKIIGE